MNLLNGFRIKKSNRKKLDDIKKIMDSWETSRIYFHDYDRLIEINKILLK